MGVLEKRETRPSSSAPSWKGRDQRGAETTEVRLHDIHLKGCMGCLSCRKDPGVCKQEDDLSPFLEALKTCRGYVIGSPIYMYHVTGQMKIFVDRAYSLYISREKEPGVYDAALAPGKTYALVTSQGAPRRRSFRSGHSMAGRHDRDPASGSMRWVESSIRTATKGRRGRTRCSWKRPMK